MKCPYCLSERTPQPIREPPLPWFLTPLRFCIRTVRCDACLHHYYHIRPVGWLIGRASFLDL